MSGCEGYRALAGVYDLLNREIDYTAWADFIEQCFDRYLPARPELVLDLACGTGIMTLELSRRGYDMIGVDGSADMLSALMPPNPKIQTCCFWSRICARSNCTERSARLSAVWTA